jgi:hypothetical protein
MGVEKLGRFAAVAVIPCAPRHEMLLRRHGVATDAGVLDDPG